MKKYTTTNIPICSWDTRFILFFLSVDRNQDVVFIQKEKTSAESSGVTISMPRTVWVSRGSPVELQVTIENGR